MSTIKVKNLTVNNITGVDLFSDSESFMRDLAENELDLQGGGKFKNILPTPPVKEFIPPAPTPPIILPLN